MPVVVILTIAMAHPRELIPQAVVALLTSAATAAGARVYEARVDPHKKSGLPALSVDAPNDSRNEDASSEMEDARDLALEITGWAHADAVDALAEQVEVAMRSDEYLGGLASNVVHVGTVKDVAVDGRSDPVIWEVVLTYTVTYHIARSAT